MDIQTTADIDSSNIPPFVWHLDENKPDPELPPSPTPHTIQVDDVFELKCKYDAKFLVGEPFHANITSSAAEAPTTIDNLHHLWDTFMFPTPKQGKRSIPPLLSSNYFPNTTPPHSQHHCLLRFLRCTISD